MRIAILGAGNIARHMAYALQHIEEAECYAIASREKERAEQFAKEFGFYKAYGSYKELVEDSQVQLVYIATPHSHHYEHIKLCLTYGKPVLCEKAFTANAKQAKELIALAREKKIFLGEAMWTRYMPIRKILREWLENDIIGEITSLTANLGYVLSTIPRMKEPALAGGALLDLGVYPINFAYMVFGNEIKRVDSTAVLTKEGVDLQNSIILHYKDNKIAMLHSNMGAATDQCGKIYGSKGYIVVENIINWEQLKVYSLDKKEITTYKRLEQINGYEYEIKASIRAIQNNEIECKEMPHTETIYIMELMDSLREKWGVIYPFEHK